MQNSEGCLRLFEWRKMKIKVPKRIKIASHTYEVAFDNRATDSAGTMALTRPLYETILLSKEAKEGWRNQLFLHEVLHMIDRFWFTQISEENLERLSEGLAVFLFDNLGIELDWSEIK